MKEQGKKPEIIRDFCIVAIIVRFWEIDLKKRNNKRAEGEGEKKYFESSR